MKTSLLLAFILLTSLLGVGFPLAADPVMQARVYFETKAQWLDINTAVLDIVWRDTGYVEIITDQEEIDSLVAMGYPVKIIHSDLSAFYRSRLPDKAMGAYKGLEEINLYIDGIISDHSDIVSPRVIIGQSIEWRDIYAFKISDNPGLDEDEPEILFTSGIHAREVIGPEVLFYFADYLTDNYGSNPTVTDLVDNREMWFIVMINPDGYWFNELTDPFGGGMWRKNSRLNDDGSYGVDLNRNFGYMWGYDNIGSSPVPEDETYRGTGPFSEPETQAVRDFVLDHEFAVAVFYHSYSNLVIWPWGYNQENTPDQEIFAILGDSITSFNGYAPMPIWQFYAVNGGSDDWLYGEQTTKDKIIALTIEVGSYSDGFWPPAERILPLVSENLGPNLYLAWAAGHIDALKPPKAPQLYAPDTVPANGFTLYWNHEDSLNPAVEFDLRELGGRHNIVDPAESFENWTVNKFSVSSQRAYSGSTSFFSELESSSAHHLTSNAPFGVQPGDTLTFMTWYKIEYGWDYAYVEVSPDGASFTPIRGNISTDYNPHLLNRGYGITGESDGWVRAVFDLSPYAGKDIIIRLSIYTDDFTLLEGIYIDDIFPVPVFDYEDSFTAITDTFYTFSNKPAADYYYKVRALDGENQWSPFSNLRRVSVMATYACGDANGDGNINIGDAIYLISHIFKDGAPPVPVEAGDANGDGAVNVGDAIYIINHVFKDGSPPTCP